MVHHPARPLARAPDGSPSSLRDDLDGLWGVMAGELTLIFEHCQDFDPSRP
ncbi:MAG: hypothetical protein VKK97_05790 [Synechococcaceae cyanobacterium]|nr:hypothetical protein [Synechococcaceae cyanobacterium]